MIISILLSTILFFVAILLTPGGDSAVSAFATDFKRWCFDYDPLSGSMEWGYVYMYLVQPFIIAIVVYAVWRQPLLELKAIGWRNGLPYALAGTGIVLLLALFLPYVGTNNDYSDRELLFEPERIRTSFMAPPFEMVDQDSTLQSLIPTGNKITIVTGIYSTCGETCPLIVQQIYRVMSRLNAEERQQIRVFALTLDPETDTPTMMKAMLTAHGVDQSYFKGLTGKPAYVDSLLSAYQFAKSRNPESQILDHVNLINVVDPEGRLAFRFTLGNNQEDWMEQSIRYLIKESL